MLGAVWRGACDLERATHVRNRWVSLLCGCVLMLMSGTAYMFSVYAPDIKKRLDLSQSEINLVGTAGNFGLFISGVPLGYIFDIFGPRMTNLIGAVLLFGGYFMMWAGLQGYISSNYVCLSIYLAISGAGSAGTYSSALACNARNFSPKRRGLIIGILVGLFGLSAALFTQIYDSAFDPKVNDFLMFLSICLGGSVIICMFGLDLVGDQPVAQLKAIDSEQHIQSLDETREPLTPVLKPAESDAKDGLRTSSLFAGYQDIHGDLSLPPPKTPLQALRTPDYLLYCLTMGLAVSCGLTLVNNLGSLVISLGSDNGAQNILVIIFSVMDTIGRAGFGLISDWLSPRYIGRTVLFFISVVLMFVTMLYTAFADVEMLYFGIGLLGIAYGGLWCIGPTMVQENWGARYFATNLNMAIVWPGVISYFLATLLAGKLYDEHIDHDHHKNATLAHDFSARKFIPLASLGNSTKHDDHEDDCYGKECFQLTFLICTGVCVLGMGAAALLWYRLRPMYNLLARRQLAGVPDEDVIAVH